MKKPKKLTKADREAVANFERIQREWDRMGKFARTSTSRPSSDRLVLDLSPPPGRESSRIPSRVTSGGDTSRIDNLHYTGTQMLGIAQMSKSNAVPVFAKQEAIDIARMRRN